MGPDVPADSLMAKHLHSNYLIWRPDRHPNFLEPPHPGCGQVSSHQAGSRWTLCTIASNSAWLQHWGPPWDPQRTYLQCCTRREVWGHPSIKGACQLPHATAYSCWTHCCYFQACQIGWTLEVTQLSFLEHPSRGHSASPAETVLWGISLI